MLCRSAISPRSQKGRLVLRQIDGFKDLRAALMDRDCGMDVVIVVVFTLPRDTDKSLSLRSLLRDWLDGKKILPHGDWYPGMLNETRQGEFLTDLHRFPNVILTSQFTKHDLDELEAEGQLGNFESVLVRTP